VLREYSYWNEGLDPTSCFLLIACASSLFTWLPAPVAVNGSPGYPLFSKATGSHSSKMTNLGTKPWENKPKTEVLLNSVKEGVLELVVCSLQPWVEAAAGMDPGFTLVGNRIPDVDELATGRARSRSSGSP